MGDYAMHTLDFYIAHVSLVFILIFFVVIARLETKNQLVRYFMAFMVWLFVWTFGVLAQQYCVDTGYLDLIIIFENLTYIGVSFLAVQMLLISIAFTSPGKQRPKSIYLVFAVPILTQILIWTNDFHHAFYINYNFLDLSETVFGWYFFIHAAYSYACLFISILLIVRFALKSKGASNPQILLILVGTAIPIAVNVCYTFGIGGFTIFATPVAFLIPLLAYFFGVLRFNILRLAPIAMRTVIDKTSDLYIVVDENMIILDYNEPFNSVFSPLANLKKHISISDALLPLNNTGVTDELVIDVIKQCQSRRETIHRDIEMTIGGEYKYYSVEFTAIIIESEYFGCIIMLRDITQAMRDMEEIKQNHLMLIERERLASLGQLIGGIAHNLKTPIMATSGRAQNLETLISEYEDSLDDENVTKDDHREIVNEMRNEVDKIQDHMAYISEIITTVKEQTIKLNEDTLDFFTIDELVRRIYILMQHELIRNNCELIYDKQIDEEKIIKGDINSFVQIVDNIIINAIHAYGGARGKIWLKITETPRDIIISVRDMAGGIPIDIQDKLFRQMFTSKGKDGTGLGLYISHSTIVGKYGGKMWFNSIEGQGSEFFISIPLVIKHERFVRENEN